jgi:hypothetical protein
MDESVELRWREQAGTTVVRYLEPGTQHRGWARLDKIFDLKTPGRYIVRAISCVSTLDGKSRTSIVSGPVRFEILPAPKGKPREAAEPGKGGPKR